LKSTLRAVEVEDSEWEVGLDLDPGIQRQLEITTVEITTVEIITEEIATVADIGAEVA